MLPSAVTSPHSRIIPAASWVPVRSASYSSASLPSGMRPGAATKTTSTSLT